MSFLFCVFKVQNVYTRLDCRVKVLVSHYSDSLTSPRRRWTHDLSFVFLRLLLVLRCRVVGEFTW
jgi:hypothetical protein